MNSKEIFVIYIYKIGHLRVDFKKQEMNFKIDYFIALTEIILHA